MKTDKEIQYIAALLDAKEQAISKFNVQMCWWM